MLSPIVKLCEAGQFEDAYEAIKQQIEEKNTSSELYRLKGQVELEMGSVDDSINSLIESLTIDKKNQSSLLLIGNIYALHKSDIDTAMTYYSQVLEYNTDNYVALTNIGGVIAQSGDLDNAMLYFKKAAKQKPNYVQALYGLTLTLYRTNKNDLAFSEGLKVLTNIQKSSDNEAKKVQPQATALLIEIAKNIVSGEKHSNIYEGFLEELKKASSKTIEVVIDANISTPAKIEIAENYGREEHRLIIKQRTKAYAYYVMHELMHLKLILEARAENVNEIFVSTNENEDAFNKRFNKYSNVIAKAGFEKSQKEELRQRLFKGINLQIYNAPLDLIIEHRLYHEYPDIRPVQLLGLLEIIQPSVQGAKDKSLKKLIPPFIRDANIILASTVIIQLKELYGIDKLNEIPDKHLVKKAEVLYQDFLDVRNDKSAGEEYDMIRWWSEELHLQKYFELKLESNASPKQKEYLPEELIAQLESDPFNLSTDVEWENEQMRKFILARKEEGLNMAVVFYMVDAMNHIEGLTKSKIKEIGFEIATLGQSGIDPNKKDTYNLATVQGKKFTGWMLLAWMYVSWMNFEPSMAKQMGLEFQSEYKFAKSIP